MKNKKVLKFLDKLFDLVKDSDIKDAISDLVIDEFCDDSEFYENLVGGKWGTQ